VSGRAVPALVASGGMTQSPLLMRLLADTLGVPLVVATVIETASLGSAILAAVGAGLHAGIPEAVAAMTASRRVEPDPARTADCDARYRKWREVYDTLLGWSL
jgi:sugar (pentulose or hexulose) kinase